MSLQRQKLQELEKTNNYLFHGSGSFIEEFEPRQAYNFKDGKKIPDGEPSVFASPVTDYAIFMALINKENCSKGYRSSVGFYNGIPQYKATRDTLAQLTKETRGYVYIFNQGDFEHKREGEWVSYKSVKSVETVLVHLDDFSPEIGEIL